MAVVAAVTVGLAAGLPRLALHTEGSALYPTGNAVVDTSELDRLRFEEPRQVVVLVGCRDEARDASAGHGAGEGSRRGCLANPSGLRFLRSIHEELEALPGVRREGVLSVAGLIELGAEAGSLSLRRHLDEIPDDPAAFDRLMSRIRSHSLTDGLLLSRDGHLAAFFVPLAENRRVSSLIDELLAWRHAQAAQHSDYEIRLTGPQVAEATLGRMVLRDLQTLIPLMLIAISLVLLLTFGNAGGVLIPLAESGVVLLWTFGAMGWLGIPVTLVTTILPVVLMAMSITDEIHLLECLQRQPSELGRTSKVLRALDEVGRPIVLTSVTTSLGFLSFLSASIVPMRHFGLFTAFGITAAMLLTFSWIPALMVLLPEAWLARPARPRVRVPELGLAWLAAACVRRPTSALAAGAALLLLSLPGIRLLQVQDAWVDNFDPASELVRAERDFNDTFWGSYRFDVVFQGEPDFFYSSTGAALLESFERQALRAPHVGGVESPLTVLGEIARALGETQPLSQLPEMALADLATLGEMSSGQMSLRRVLSDRGDAARTRLYVNSPDYAKAQQLRADLDRRLAGLPLPDPMQVHYSGDLPVALEVVDDIVGNQLRSIGWALLGVAGLLALFFAPAAAGPRARVLAAGVAMAPVTAATAFVLGAMGLLGVPLGIATSMFASLTVGVGVDFGIHFLHGYRVLRDSGADDAAALRATVERTGRALRWNALVLSLGFLVLSLSSLKPNHSLGLLLASAMLSCYIAALLLLPGLARWAVPTGPEKRSAAGGLALLSLFALLGSALAAPSASAAPRACPQTADPAARAIMAGIESDRRSRTLIAHMRFSTRYREGHPLAALLGRQPETKSLWAVFSSNALETRSVFVFSGPGRLAGTTLLMRDRIAGIEGDAMWLYLRAFGNFSQLESTARRRTTVPGSPITYEDARGFFPLDKYVFSFRTAWDPTQTGTRNAEIRACPRTAELARDLGYGSLQISVDTQKRLVVEVDFRDLEGHPLKRYRVERDQQVGDSWYPKRALIEQLANGTRTPIDYQYWHPEHPPPKALYAASIEPEPFRPRLERYLREIGLGEQIGPELRAADASVRRWQERWGRPPRAADTGSDDPDDPDEPQVEAEGGAEGGGGGGGESID